MMKIDHRLTVIDSHTAGEPTRMILSGYPKLTGATLAERMAELRDRHDWVRRVAMTEPRGHRDMFGCVLMPPLDPAADIAAIFMDAGRYYNMCGHASLGIAGMMVETGRVPTTPPETRVVIETPAGLVEATVATDAEGAVTGVSVIDVASFAVALDRVIEVPDFGAVRVDIGYGGNFFVIARAEDMGFADVGPALTDPLIAAGVALRSAANAQIPVCHPERPHIDRIDIAMLTGPPTAAANARSIVVLGDGQADRSPCGTGTCARMAVLHAKGALAVGQAWRHQSSIGTVFDARILSTATVGKYSAVVPWISCVPYLTGFSDLVVAHDDPVGYGFSLQAPDALSFRSQRLD